MLFSTAMERVFFIQDKDDNYEIYFETVRMQAIVRSSWYIGASGFGRKRKGPKKTQQTTWG